MDKLKNFAVGAFVGAIFFVPALLLGTAYLVGTAESDSKQFGQALFLGIPAVSLLASVFLSNKITKKDGISYSATLGALSPALYVLGQEIRYSF